MRFKTTFLHCFFVAGGELVDENPGIYPRSKEDAEVGAEDGAEEGADEGADEGAEPVAGRFCPPPMVGGGAGVSCQRPSRFHPLTRTLICKFGKIIAS